MVRILDHAFRGILVFVLVDPVHDDCVWLDSSDILGDVGSHVLMLGLMLGQVESYLLGIGPVMSLLSNLISPIDVSDVRERLSRHLKIQI